MSSVLVQLAALPTLLRDRSAEGRRALLDCITALYLSDADSCSETVREGFGMLLKDLGAVADEDGRAALASTLLDVETPPMVLVDALLNDTAFVAAPLLVHSPQLAEDDLIDLIDRHGAGHAAVIAQRQGLSATLVSHIVALEDPHSLTCLAENADAPLQRADFEILLKAAPALPALQLALITRPDLPADVAIQLGWHVAPQLGGKAFERAVAIQPDALQLALQTAAARGIATGDAQPHPPHALAFAVDKQTRNELKEPLVVRLLRDGQLDAFHACFDRLTGIDRATSEALLEEPGGYGLMTACRAAGFARSTCSTLVRLGEMGSRRGTEEVFRLMSCFETLDPATADRLVGYWRALFASEPLEDDHSTEAPHRAAM
ncbi:DUF2336 domain-containing protein [Pyruvatibacter mobilis]|uniref:DUF2336 domain-containing protein n=1 Tax=Pyruvatibacter mobilis TaxID=1712261 RepID=UPI003BB14524